MEAHISTLNVIRNSGRGLKWGFKGGGGEAKEARWEELGNNIKIAQKKGWNIDEGGTFC